MRKFAFSTSAFVLAIAGLGLTSTPALAGQCEVNYVMSIASCGGDGACIGDAETEYSRCLRRQVIVNE